MRTLGLGISLFKVRIEGLALQGRSEDLGFKLRCLGVEAL